MKIEDGKGKMENGRQKIEDGREKGLNINFG